MKKFNTEKKKEICAMCWRTAAWTLRTLAAAALVQTVVGATHSATFWEGLHHILRFCVLAIVALDCAMMLDYRFVYYRCKKCGHIHKFNAEAKAVNASFEMEMECPNCRERSWHKRAFRKSQTV